jgi:hypothetical protein
MAESPQESAIDLLLPISSLHLPEERKEYVEAQLMT